MRSCPRLGSVNAAIVALYFAPVWGRDGLNALLSPFYGFEDRVQATAAGYFRALLDLGLDGLARTSSVLAAVKFVIAIGFVAYLIDFARALTTGRDVNRETMDCVLALAIIALVLWAWPALGSGAADLIRLHATQFLLLCGAMVLIVIERHIEENDLRSSRAMVPFGQQPPAAC
jgi:hypothetical protein